MSKQSSIEWLFDKFVNSDLKVSDIMKTFEQAKQMHKEEIKNAHLLGLIYPLEMEANKQAEQYYQETYGGNNE